MKYLIQNCIRRGVAGPTVHCEASCVGFIGKSPPELKYTLPQSWRDRRRFWFTFLLTLIAAYILIGNLLERIMKLRIPFEEVVYSVPCDRIELDTNTTCSGKSRGQDGICRLVAIQPSNGLVFWHESTNFLLIDFARSATEWYNTKSADAKLGVVFLKHQSSLGAFAGNGENFARGLLA